MAEKIAASELEACASGGAFGPLYSPVVGPLLELAKAVRDQRYKPPRKDCCAKCNAMIAVERVVALDE